MGGTTSICGVELSEFGVWILIVWISVVLLGGAALPLLIGGAGSFAIYIAVVLMLPFTLLIQALG